jgi:hypothetical protein
VETPAGVIVGRAEAVEADGRLRVLVAGAGGPGPGSGSQLRWFSAGDVVHLRVAGGSPG